MIRNLPELLAEGSSIASFDHNQNFSNLQILVNLLKKRRTKNKTKLSLSEQQQKIFTFFYPSVELICLLFKEKDVL